MNVKSVLYRHPGRFIKSIKYLSKIAENKQQVTLCEYHSLGALAQTINLVHLVERDEKGKWRKNKLKCRNR